ncbi:PAS domain S-box protein [Caulobacter rhizosphaerae]|jgi:PAS domain S-box-containing protein|uniref:PAS domain S-box protein n=1 Tax=Caulobacter rhizosphaerae TaxID=2010972 RepID=UPI0013D4B349|nr:PAS domain S-box protein [Caulobacter rhizosphaerae]GGL19213.1 sensor histidine kinase [Caulobacter rhizosphaerae]
MSNLAALQPILRTAIDPVVVMDPQGVILDWSARAEAAFGWPREEVLGRGLIEVLAPLRHQAAYRQVLARRLASPEPPVERQKSQLMAVRKDGVEVPIEVSLAAFGDPGATVFLGFIRDVADRVEVHDRLTASEARFRAAIGAVDGILWTNDASGRMVGDQPGWSALTGQTSEMYQGFGWAAAVHPDDAEPTLRAWKAAVAQGGPYTFEHRVRRHDGAWRDFAVRAVAVLEPDGSIREWIGVHTDITERKRAEERLREGEARFRAMADSAPAPVWMTSAEGGITFANEAFAEFAGLDAQDLLGDAWIGMIHPEDVATVGARRAAARGAPEGPRPWSFEARFRCGDGTYRWMVANARPQIDARGQFQGYIGMAMDMTETKAAEARQRLLINELNHRVKNTLASIQSIVRQTLRADEATARVRERLIERLLAMSAAHDVLTRESWEGAALDEIVRQGVAPFVDDRDPGRVSIAGPSLRVGASTALSLALAVHELATNAAKYGALSIPAGKVVIAWDQVGDNGAVLTWAERDGPPVAPPDRKGFGTRLLDRGLSADLGGQPKLTFDVEGVRAVLPVRLA